MSISWNVIGIDPIYPVLWKSDNKSGPRSPEKRSYLNIGCFRLPKRFDVQAAKKSVHKYGCIHHRINLITGEIKVLAQQPR